MKSALAIIFLSAVYINVSGETIKCYSCMEGLDLSKIDWSKRPNIPIPRPDQLKNTTTCGTPIENNPTISIDSSQNSCVTINMISSDEISIQTDGKGINITMRAIFPIGKCTPFEQLTSNPLLTVTCRECREDFCNSANSVQLSMVTLVIFAVPYIFSKNFL